MLEEQLKKQKKNKFDVFQFFFLFFFRFWDFQKTHQGKNKKQQNSVFSRDLLCFFCFFLARFFAILRCSKNLARKIIQKETTFCVFQGFVFSVFFNFWICVFFLQGFLRFWDFQKTYIARKTNKQIQWFPGFLIFGFVFHLFIFPLGPILNLFFFKSR